MTVVRSKLFISFPDRANVQGFSSVDNTAVYKIPANWDIVAGLSGRAVTESNKHESQIRICKDEIEPPVMAEQHSLRACEIFSQYYDEHDSNKILDANKLFFEKYVQTRLSRSAKREKKNLLSTVKFISKWMCNTYF